MTNVRVHFFYADGNFLPNDAERQSPTPAHVACSAPVCGGGGHKNPSNLTWLRIWGVLIRAPVADGSNPEVILKLS
jgi:hypothetical protein